MCIIRFFNKLQYIQLLIMNAENYPILWVRMYG